MRSEVSRPVVAGRCLTVPPVVAGRTTIFAGFLAGAKTPGPSLVFRSRWRPAAPTGGDHWKVSRGGRDERRHVTHGDLPWSAVTNTKYQLKLGETTRDLRPRSHSDSQPGLAVAWAGRVPPPLSGLVCSVKFNYNCWLPFCLLWKYCAL